MIVRVQINPMNKTQMMAVPEKASHPQVFARLELQMAEKSIRVIMKFTTVHTTVLDHVPTKAEIETARELQRELRDRIAALGNVLFEWDGPNTPLKTYAQTKQGELQIFTKIPPIG